MTFALWWTTKLADAMAPVTKAPTDHEPQVLNAGVDVDGKTPDDTAKAWLAKQGFAGE